MSSEANHNFQISPKDNRWDLLATLYGQPTCENRELQIRNRQAWNRYMCQWLREDGRALLTAPHFAEEVTGLSELEIEDMETTFVRWNAAAPDFWTTG
jgi:hypothetical protein